MKVLFVTGKIDNAIRKVIGQIARGYRVVLALEGVREYEFFRENAEEIYVLEGSEAFLKDAKPLTQDEFIEWLFEAEKVYTL